MKVVCFGGGNGVPRAVLEKLKNYDDIEITSVTSMVDNGGSTGELRRELRVLPPGDIRRHILALSEAEDWKKKLWELRFANNIKFKGGHRGHSFANVFIAGLEDVLRDYDKILSLLHDFMKVKGKVLPAVLEDTMLYAELENNEIIEGEDEIDFASGYANNLRIKEIFLEPRVPANPEVIKAIEKAEAIIIGPGDLYSSLLPCFLPEGMKEAIQKSKAKKVFICPAMTKLGETNGFKVSDFAKEIEKYIGCELDYAIFATNTPRDIDRIRRYKIEKPFLIDVVKFDGKKLGKKFVGGDILLEEGAIEYDSKKLVKLLVDVIRN